MENILFSCTLDGSEFKYDDNCPVCEAMKMAERRGRDLTETELAVAFIESKRRGHFVGGSLFGDPM